MSEGVLGPCWVRDAPGENPRKLQALGGGRFREFIQELRGDVRKEAIDIYNHIDKMERRESYLTHIPQMGI